MGSGLSIRNESGTELLVILSQLTPLHWNIQPIKPGQTWHAKTGKVWFTLKVDQWDRKRIPTKRGVAARIGAMAVGATLGAMSGGTIIAAGVAVTGALSMGAAVQKASSASSSVYAPVSMTGMYADGRTIVVRDRPNEKTDGYELYVHDIELYGGQGSPALDCWEYDLHGKAFQIDRAWFGNNTSKIDVSEILQGMASRTSAADPSLVLAVEGNYTSVFGDPGPGEKFLHIEYRTGGVLAVLDAPENQNVKVIRGLTEAEALSGISDEELLLRFQSLQQQQMTDEGGGGSPRTNATIGSENAHRAHSTPHHRAHSTPHPKSREASSASPTRRSSFGRRIHNLFSSPIHTLGEAASAITHGDVCTGADGHHGAGHGAGWSNTKGEGGVRYSIVKHGQLRKQGRMVRSWKKRHFVFQIRCIASTSFASKAADSFYSYSDGDLEAQRQSGSQQTNVVLEALLQYYDYFNIRDPGDSGRQLGEMVLGQRSRCTSWDGEPKSHPFGFQVDDGTGEGGRVILLSAASESEKCDWMAAIDGVLQGLNVKQQQLEQNMRQCEKLVQQGEMTLETYQQLRLLHGHRQRQEEERRLQAEDGDSEEQAIKEGLKCSRPVRVDG
jgi:hypothetical protein